MTRDNRTPVPPGLPNRFADPEDRERGFRRLCKFLAIENRQQREALLDSDGVKKAVGARKRPGLKTAERHREGITAFYAAPDARRVIWRDTLKRPPEDDPRTHGVPSLEIVALHDYDAQFRERAVDPATIEDALRDLPGAMDRATDTPDWQRPALTAWPALRHDIADWSALPDDRRASAALALFAVATVLDDARLLQWAARAVDALADEFAALLSGLPEDSPTDDDIIRQWQDACAAIATTAHALAADPPQPALLPNLTRHVDALIRLHEPLTELLNRSAPEKLLERVDDILARLAESGNSPIADWRPQIAAQWRSAYASSAAPDIESLRADVERLESELGDALDVWRVPRREHEALDQQLLEVKRRAATHPDALERFEAEHLARTLQQRLAGTAEEIGRAQDRVFHVAAPGNQTFDPRRGQADDDTPAPREPPEPDAADDPPPDPSDTAENAAAPEVSEITEPLSAERTPDADAAPTPSPDALSASARAQEPADSDSRPSTPARTVSEAALRADSAATEPAPPEPAPQTDLFPAPPPVDRRQASAVEGLWRALHNRRPGIAYHIARLCAEQGYAAVPPTLADIIAASMLAPHVESPDSEVARDLRPLLERIDPARLLCDERRQPERDALNLLLFSAALRPALLLPSTGAPSLLRRVSLSGRLSPVYRLANTVADHADRLQGLRLHAALFRQSHSGAWQERFDALARRVRAWHESADSKHNIYGPATTVWRRLLVHGPLARLVQFITTPDASVRSQVEDIHQQITDQRAFSELVHRTDQNRRGRNSIQGRALKQLCTDVQPAVEFSSEWLSMMDARPETSGYIAGRLEALHADLDRDGPAATTALQDAPAASAPPPLASALVWARTAVNHLLHLCGPTASAVEPTSSATIVRSRDLLYVPDLELDTDFCPASPSPVRMLDHLLRTAGHASTMRAAFDARLHRRDFIGAHLALECLQTDEAADLDQCTASFTRRIKDHRKTLRADLTATQKRIERAFCRGQLPTDDRDAMVATLTDIRRAAAPSASPLPSRPELEILTGSSRTIEDIDNRIQNAIQASIAQVRARLQSVSADRKNEVPEAKEIIEDTIARGDTQTAHEQINRLERGESVKPPASPDDPFHEFTRSLTSIETAREATDFPAILQGAKNRQTISGIHFDTLSADEARSAHDLLDAWYRMTRKASIDAVLLRRFLQGLGFNVIAVHPQRAGSLATVTVASIADRAVCPSRQFGSEANGRYRLFRHEPRAGVDAVFTSIGTEGGDPAIVLYFGRLGARREEIRARAAREHRLFLAVDEALVLFLAGHPPSRLAAFFRCTLPWSAAQPYATTSGLVPPELFYGRGRERQSIADQSGACFVYGGRQLGKTALLRRVAHDFNRPNHVAKWIDLKVNEIDRAPDLWRVLQRELQRAEIVSKRRELDPDSNQQVKRLVEEIREWLDASPSRRLLLLLDEADYFLREDADNDFRESGRLKGLMDATDRRFKVVFAGLHNVLRTTQRANHPLAHLGDPICVGAMLSNGEWKQAQALVREPLQAVGCRFERGDLSTRILAHTNYYPSLIQLYGAELIRSVRDADKSFPYDIDDNDIDRAYGSQELRDGIRERFRLTLQLDQRYDVIAYAMAFELKEGASLDRGLEREAIFRAAASWWPEGFGVRNMEFDVLLQEMEGLGVLRETEQNRYTLRNPNILLLLGNQENIVEALGRERERPAGYAPGSFRAPYRDEPAWKRGPLTRQQESQLRNGGVAVICGCRAAGLDDVQEFLGQRIGSDEFSCVQPCANVAEFERTLRTLRTVRNSITVRLVPQSHDWDVAWIRTATRVVHGKAQGKRVWTRVALVASPQDLWRLLAHAAPDLALEEWRTEPEALWQQMTQQTESLHGVHLFPLGPCDLAFLKRWLDDINATADGREAEDFQRVSGGWTVELDRFGKKKSSRSWTTRMTELEREGARDPEKRLAEEFGLVDGAAAVFRALLAGDQIDDDSVELVAADRGIDVPQVRRCVFWGALLGLLSSAGGGSWTFNPLVKRLLEAAAAR